MGTLRLSLRARLRLLDGADLVMGKRLKQAMMAVRCCACCAALALRLRWQLTLRSFGAQDSFAAMQQQNKGSSPGFTSRALK